jgi:superfamily II DNA/RNA helicase
MPTRDELADLYLAQLPYDPYPLQEEALLAWFSAEQGVLVCAPTGTGKTLIAEAALFEALHTGKMAYYTTPLIALTEQKFREMQHAAVRWGFKAEDVGLVTGNRRENPSARILVVVAEILANRLLHTEAFDFAEVSAVVMDEFHSFADIERGVVWELSLGLLPAHVRTLLLSATVGNAIEFVNWLKNSHNRKVDLVKGEERKVPLTYHWIGDQLLTELIEEMARGDDEAKRTPALVFCFNREECWSIAEQIKGKKVLSDGQQKRLVEELDRHDWSQGGGPKLKQLLMRGVGVHHAGVLPKYRRIVEELFQHKLLSICTCTETLSAGINLPARSVVLPSIMKGPMEKRVVIDASSAHQIFGRAGRPQFDKEGYVFVLAHEDDVKIARWKEKFDQIPEDTKDPGLLRAKKDLKRKMPKRRTTETYWNEQQFDKLRLAPPGKLYSKGPLPWRLLAFMLEASPEVERVRKLVAKRLMDSHRIEAGQHALVEMLLTLWKAGYVTLEPEPPKEEDEGSGNGDVGVAVALPPLESQTIRGGSATATPTKFSPLPTNDHASRGARSVPGEGLGVRAEPARPRLQASLFGKPVLSKNESASPESTESKNLPPPYVPLYARPTEEMQKLHLFRGIHPLYAVFLLNQLGIASRAERLQAMESVLELPRSIGPAVRVPLQKDLPPGPLATLRLDPLLLQLGLATAEELTAPEEPEEYQPRRTYDEAPVRVLHFADKLRKLFDYDFPNVRDLKTFPVWAAGELLEFGGDFNKYVTSKNLQKQEGLIFRHLLRLILLVKEFEQLCPPDISIEEWRADLRDIADRLAAACRQVDPASTDKALEEVEGATAEEGAE